MAYEEKLVTVTLPASGDLSASQYKLVDGSTSGQAQVLAARGGNVLGVIQDKSTGAGIGGEVGIRGITKVEAGDSSGMANAIVVGTALISSSNGTAVPSTGDIDHFIWGRAVSPLATGSTGIISANITMEGRGSSE